MEKGNEAGTDVGTVVGVGVGTTVGGTLVDESYNPDDYYDPRLPVSDTNSPLSALDPSITAADLAAMSDYVDPLAALPDDDYNPDDYYDPRLPASDTNFPLSPLDPSLPDDYYPEAHRVDSYGEDLPVASAAASTPPSGPRTYTAQDRAFLQEIYKGADQAGVKIVGVSEIKRLGAASAGSKADPVVIGMTATIVLRVGDDGALLPRRGDSDRAATSLLQMDVTPSVEFDSDGEAHVVWSAYVTRIDTATGRIVDISKSGPSSAEWKARVDGRPDSVVGNDPDFKDWVVDSMPDSPAEAVRQAMGRQGLAP